MLGRRPSFPDNKTWSYISTCIVACGVAGLIYMLKVTETVVNNRIEYFCLAVSVHLQETFSDWKCTWRIQQRLSSYLFLVFWIRDSIKKYQQTNDLWKTPLKNILNFEPCMTYLVSRTVKCSDFGISVIFCLSISLKRSLFLEKCKNWVEACARNSHIDRLFHYPNGLI